MKSFQMGGLSSGWVAAGVLCGVLALAIGLAGCGGGGGGGGDSIANYVQLRIANGALQMRLPQEPDHGDWETLVPVGSDYGTMTYEVTYGNTPPTYTLEVTGITYSGSGQVIWCNPAEASVVWPDRTISGTVQVTVP